MEIGNFLSDEIKNDDTFMNLLSELPYEWKTLSDPHHDHKVGVIRSRKSYVSEQVELIHTNCQDLKQMLLFLQLKSIKVWQ